MLTDQNWALSVGVFLPLAGVLIMMFIPKSDELMVKGVGVITALATLGVGIYTLAAFDYDQVQRVAKVVVDTRNAIKSPGSHVVRLGAPRPVEVPESAAAHS